MSRKLFSLAVGTVLVLAVSVVARSASAAPILVTNAQFTANSAYTGAAAAPSGGTLFWNVMGTGGSVGVLQNATNTGATTISVTGGTDGGVAGNAGASFSQDLMNHFNYDSTASTYTLSGVPAGTYDLYVYSLNQQSANTVVNPGDIAANTQDSDTAFTVNGGTAQDVDSNGIQDSTFTLGQSYTEFVGVSPLSGNFAVNFVLGPSGGTHGIFNGFQLVNENVPEPSSVVLLGIALSVAAFVARRHRKR